MPPRERTLQEKEAEKKKILDCALEVINDEGYHALSMRKIAKKLKFSATKIYNYYHNKDEVYIALAVESFKLFTEYIDEHLSNSNNIDVKIERLIQAIFTFSKEYKNNYEILFDLKAPRYLNYVGTPIEEIAKEKQRVGFEWFGLIKTVLKEYADEHVEINYDLDVVTLNFFSTIHGSINLYHNKLVHEICDKPQEYLNELCKRLVKNLDCIIF